MSTSTAAASSIAVASRVLNEGYGPGAWHGNDLKAALGDVTPPVAYGRPAAGRHNIAEIAVHHAYVARNVRAQISGLAAEPFVLEGDDWFAIDGEATLAWGEIQRLVAAEHEKLASIVTALESGRAKPALSDAEQFNLILGVTCHAIYHAGQVQLIKRLLGE